MTDARLLDLARRFYRRFGTMPVTLFAKLVERGFSPSQLEETWK